MPYIHSLISHSHLEITLDEKLIARLTQSIGGLTSWYSKNYDSSRVRLYLEPIQFLRNCFYVLIARTVLSKRLGRQTNRFFFLLQQLVWQKKKKKTPPNHEPSVPNPTATDLPRAERTHPYQEAAEERAAASACLSCVHCTHPASAWAWLPLRFARNAQAQRSSPGSNTQPPNPATTRPLLPPSAPLHPHTGGLQVCWSAVHGRWSSKSATVSTASFSFIFFWDLGARFFLLPIRFGFWRPSRLGAGLSALDT